MCFRHKALITTIVVSLAACSGRAKPVTAVGKLEPSPEANVGVGDCGDPGRNGVVSARPSMKRADLDLNGDGRKEPVVADRTLCTKEGNCHWNIFVSDTTTGCHRYVGTVAGSGILRSSERGDDGFSDLRVWWDFGGRRRLLLQHYRFRRGAYHITEALICRRGEGDRLLCADGGRPPSPP